MPRKVLPIRAFFRKFFAENNQNLLFEPRFAFFGDFLLSFCCLLFKSECFTMFPLQADEADVSSKPNRLQKEIYETKKNFTLYVVGTFSNHAPHCVQGNPVGKLTNLARD
jgi:hypothetical protein